MPNDGAYVLWLAGRGGFLQRSSELRIVATAALDNAWRFKHIGDALKMQAYVTSQGVFPVLLMIFEEQE